MHFLTFFLRIVLPIVILQSVYYKSFNREFVYSFFEFSNPNILGLYVVLMAVKSINALLIIANHKLKRSYLQLVIISGIELVILIGTYYSIDSWSVFSDIGHISRILPSNIFIRVGFQSVIVICALLLWKKEQKNEHMNFIVKTSFYFIIPFVFLFLTSINTSLFSKNQCHAILAKSEANDYKEFVKNSGIIGRDITTINSLKNHTYLPSGKYIAYLMDSQCESCWRGIENVKKFKNLSSIEDVILYDIGNPKNRTKIFDAFGLSGRFKVYGLDRSVLKYIMGVPAMVTIEDKEIKNIYVKSIPCTYEIGTLF
ncbi:hypothetical protein ABW636_07220 [Aquimarina sp. 2201CG1-2-11]|uniref:hypothetical protein n=1 Tax=Aquimarina discodermiae TaxID=3231043 RepID=UPI003461AFBA